MAEKGQTERVTVNGREKHNRNKSSRRRHFGLMACCLDWQRNI